MKKWSACRLRWVPKIDNDCHKSLHTEKQQYIGECKRDGGEFSYRKSELQTKPQKCKKTKSDIYLRITFSISWDKPNYGMIFQVAMHV